MAAMLLTICLPRGPQAQRAWRHFWGIKENDPRELVQLYEKQTHNEKVLVKTYINPSDIFEYSRIKYKSEKTPAFGVIERSEFDFALR